jgi:hypothetical protein
MIKNEAHKSIHIDVVAFVDRDGTWIAQGIQYDIAAHARSPGGLREAFMRQLAANLALNSHLGRETLEGIPPAPARFKALFEHAKEQLTPLAPPPSPPRPIREQIDMRLVEAA